MNHSDLMNDAVRIVAALDELHDPNEQKKRASLHGGVSIEGRSSNDRIFIIIQETETVVFEADGEYVNDVEVHLFHDGPWLETVHGYARWLEELEKAPSSTFNAPQSDVQICASPVHLASSDVLYRTPHYLRMQWTVRNERYSRRGWLDALEDTLYPHKERFIAPDGRLVGPPDISVIFEIDNRWWSYYETIDPRNGIAPLMVCTKSFLRLQAIDAFYQIRHPARAKLFRK